MTETRGWNKLIGNRHISILNYWCTFLVDIGSKTNAFCRSTVIKVISDNLF